MFFRFRLLILCGLSAALIFSAGYLLGRQKEPLGPLFNQNSILSTTPVAKDRSLDEFSYENLKKRAYPGGEIVLSQILGEKKKYKSYLFYFYAEGQKVSGQANLPVVGSGQGAAKFPVVILLRGYVDKENYRTGLGTRRAAAFFAENGFLTLAPDFLGYGQSDGDDPHPLKARFETYITAINLINSLSSLPQAQSDEIFLWGHSNGGQIALSLLEITGRGLPTTLWAPVSKPFPYSILFYSDEASDSGRLLRKVVANFDRSYDADHYSLTTYLDWLAAPLEIHQGLADEVVPPAWSRQLVVRLKKQEKEVKYYEYPGADHNFARAFGVVVARDLKFFKSYLKQGR